MSKIIVWISPKTAGASSVALNAAILQMGLNPATKVALVEVSRWSSQATLFPALNAHHWAELKPFLGTKEWETSLLQRAKTDLGPSVFWSPTGSEWPPFNLKFAISFLDLLTQNQAVIYVDLNVAVDADWQQWWLTQADQVIGVVTPDPLSLNAWRKWVGAFKPSEKLSWILNQAGPGERKNLATRFARSAQPLLGVLRQEPRTFWRQMYQSFPVVLNRRSGFKKDLLEVLSNL